MQLIKSVSLTKRFAVRSMLGISLVLWAGAALPVTVGPGQQLDIFLDSVNPNTGVSVLNQSTSAGEVSLKQVSIAGDDKLRNLQAPAGFRLLDNSLFVESTLPSGKRRAGIRIGYERLGRAGIRRAGIRVGSLRLLRADIARERWLPAQQRILNKRRADIRRIRGLATLRLGNYGFDKNNQNVWAVTDLGGSQYFAIGGLAIVPLPAAWLLFLSASGALFLVSRRRDRRPA